MQNTSLVQFYPSRVTVTPAKTPMQFHEVDFNRQCPSYYRPTKEQYESNFAKRNNPFILSKASKKKLMDSINSMYILSKSRAVKMKTGKVIYNYKMSFITLTLPAKQNHTDVEIKKEALNQFLVEIRKHYEVKNYIWKAELQANKNIHFHLIIDKYIDFQALRRRWNRCINKLGYVDAYQEKMQNTSLTEYHKQRKNSNKDNFQESAIMYAKGKQSNWSNPNSVDVRSVYSKNELAIYLSKYITKKVSKTTTSPEEEARQISFGRSWARSQSLSKLKYQNKYLVSEVKNILNYLKSETKKVLQISDEWFTAFYFSAEKLHENFKKFHTTFIFNNAKMYNYPFPCP